MVAGAGPADNHPSSVRVFVGRAAEDLDFSSVDDTTPAYEGELPVNANGEFFFAPTGRATFTNVTSVALFFPENHGDLETTGIGYIGMQGDHTHHRREAVHTTYELIDTGGATELTGEASAQRMGL